MGTILPRRGKRARTVFAIAERLEWRVLLSSSEQELLKGAVLDSDPTPPPGAIEYALSAAASASASGGSSKVLDVPEYIWYHGCSPTSAAMMLAYWDTVAYPNLFPGDSTTQTDAVDDLIASPEHIRDWVPTPDPVGAGHVGNCIADYMGTSRDPHKHGYTYLEDIPPGLETYAYTRGYSDSLALNIEWDDLSQSTIRDEIDGGSPLLIHVDSSGDGDPDHTMVCIGYRTSPHFQFAAHTTWGGMPGVQWFDLRPVEEGYKFGVDAVTLFWPVGMMPDLVPSYSDVVQPQLQWGMNFTYKFEVKNVGIMPVAAPSTVKFYLSSDPTITSADHLLGSASVSVLAGGSAYSDSVTLKLPATPPSGFSTPDTVYIGMIVDAPGDIPEGFEANNSNLGLDVSYNIVSINKGADLVGTAFKLDTPILNLGTTTATFTVSNAGDVKADPFLVRFYLSSDSTITSADTLLASKSITSAMAPGAQYVSTITLNVPTEDPFQTGGKYTIGMIVDATDAVDEGNESNNRNRGIGYDKAAADYGVKIVNATFNNGDGAMDIQNHTVWAANDGLWHLSGRHGRDSGHSGGYSMYYGRESAGDYDAGDSAGAFLTKNISLPQGPCLLSFNYLADVESGSAGDDIRCQVEDVVHGSITTLLSKTSGLDANTDGAWRRATIDLSEYAGSVIRLRWVFDTLNASNNTGEGWYIDDIAVWAVGNAETVEAYRSLKYDGDYRHKASAISWAGDHDTFVFNEEQIDGLFDIATVTLGRANPVHPGLAVYDFKTGAMLYMDGGTGSADGAKVTLANSGNWNSYLVEVWDVPETYTGDLDVTVNGNHTSSVALTPVDSAGHAERLHQSIASKTDTDFFTLVAPPLASGSLTVEVSPEDNQDLLPRMQIWKNDVSDAPDRVVFNNQGRALATFSDIRPGDVFHISVADNTFANIGYYDWTADFSMALPGKMIANAAEGFAYFNHDGNCTNALNASANIGSSSDVDSYVFAGDGGWVGDYTFTATAPAGSSVKPVLAVYDGTTGEQLKAASSVGGTTVQLTLSLTGATKYVVAVADNSHTGTGPVVLNVHTADSSMAVPVAINSAGQGSSASRTVAVNDTDFVRFTVPALADGTLSIVVQPTSTTFDPAFAVFDASGTMLGERSAGEAGESEKLDLTGVTPGQTLYLSVIGSSYATSGHYNLSLSFGVHSTQIPGTSGDDTVYLRVDPNQAEITQIFVNTPLNGSPTYSVDRATVPALSFSGGDGDDRLIIDCSNGNPLLAHGFSFDGGNGANLVVLTSTSSANNLWADAHQMRLDSAIVSYSGVPGVRLAPGLGGSMDLCSLHVGSLAYVDLAAGGHVLRTGELSLASDATLDLADNDLIVKAMTETKAAVLAAVSNSIHSARGSDGKWLGKGLTSSAAQAHKQTGLAAMLNDKNGTAILSTFDGLTVGVNDILVKYTWNGDANLDGAVDAADYFLVDSGFITQQGGYRNGDLNYDGVVDAGDYFLIDSAFIAQSGPLATSAVTADVGLARNAKPDSILSRLFSTEPVL